MPSDRAWPSGAVTFLFSDIEDSTPLWDRHRAAMRLALAEHDELLRTAVSANNGVTVKTTGDGIHAVFASPDDALTAAVDAQRALRDAAWPSINPDHIRVRMGLHTGEAELRAGDYYGTAVIRAARLMSIGHGGQILLSGTTAELVQDSLPGNIDLLDLGEHYLKGLSRAGQVFQVAVSDLPSNFPPLRTGEAAVGNLPQPLTDFIGRERELTLIKEQLGQARLLTLTGPGGTGKTRLSIEAGRHSRGRYDHGVWLVELAPLSNEDLIPTTVATLFDLREQTGVPINDTLTDYLRSKRLLLILDNCEHLIAACARFVANMLPVAPQLTILASSREGLGVPGERTVHIPAMGIPGRDLVSPDEIAEFEAVRLFVSRARFANSAFELTDTNAASVGRIVRRLDGIPLAIELAAARVKLLTPDQIAARLDDRFRLLTGGSRTALPRQQTLRALIDWSYDLLDEDERWFLRQMAVFAGGWTLEAAEMMVARRDTRALDALDLLANLVNKSLVRIDESDGEIKYRYLETIRQYALDRLIEAGEAPAARDTHYDFFQQLVQEQLGERLESFGSMVQVERLEDELDNLRAALDWGVSGRPMQTVYLLHRLSGIWAMSGLVHELQQRMHALLRELAQFPVTDDVTERDLSLARAFGLMAITIGAGITGGDEEGYRTAVEAVEIFRADGTREVSLADALYWQGLIGLEIGRHEGFEAVQECYVIGRRIDNNLLQFVALALLARWELVRSNVDAAADYLGLARQFPQETDSPILIVYLAFAESILARTKGDYEGAKLALARGVEALRRAHLRTFANVMDSELAHTLRASGDLRGATEIYQRTITEWQDLGHRAAVANQLECLAFIAVLEGRLERAARLFGAADGIRAVLSSMMTPSEREEYELHVGRLRAEMDNQARDLAWNNGRRLNLDDAVQFALEDA